MARKSIGYTKLIWICPNCQTRNPGPKKVCSTCGSPQPDDVHFIQADKEEILRQKADILRAKKGADIHCPFCGTRNTADAKICTQCGGKITGGKKRAAGRVVGAHKSGRGEGIVCTTCGTRNKPNAPRCSHCRGPLSTGREAIGKNTLAAGSQQSGKMIWIVVGILAVLIAGMLIARGCIRSISVGTVDRSKWVRTVAVEQYITVIREDWLDEIPATAYISSCDDRYRYSSSQPGENTIEVCGTPYTIDDGTGYGEIVQDCEYEVYDSYCEYEINDWEVVEVLQMEGYGPNVSWPVVESYSNQRAGELSETYTIWFQTGEGSYSFETDDYSLFTSLREGSQWELSFDGYGNIRDVSPN